MRPAIRDLIKKYPKLRGYKNRPVSAVPEIISLDKLEKNFQKGDIVSPQVLYGRKLITRQGGVLPDVKILGTGAIKKPLTVEKCLVSKSAKEKIEKAGGIVK